MVPLVSVVIPTYNRAGLVQEAIASVEAQSFRDFEILVVDDGSTDATAEALALREGIRVLRHGRRRRGVAAARNLGIAAAKGEWLAFLDSDDLWLPDKLAIQMAYLEGRPDLLLCQTDEIWVRNEVRVNKPESHRKVAGEIFLPSLERCMVSPSAVVLHRRLLEEHGGFDEALPAAEDYDLWLRLTRLYEVGLVEAPLVVKRGGHPDQLSGQWGIDRFRIQALAKLLKEEKLPELYRQAARMMLARKCVIYAQGCEKRGKNQEAEFYRNLGEQEGWEQNFRMPNLPRTSTLIRDTNYLSIKESRHTPKEGSHGNLRCYLPAPQPSAVQTRGAAPGSPAKGDRRRPMGPVGDQSPGLGDHGYGR